MNNDKDVLHVKDMAKSLGVTEIAMRHMLRSGEITGARHIGRRWMISKENWLKLINGESNG